MVVESQDLYIIWERNRGYNLNHIYMDQASAELALLTYFTPTRVQTREIHIEKIEGKKLEHCCEM